MICYFNFCFPDKHVPAVQDFLCFVSSGREKRHHPEAQERPVPTVWRADVGNREFPKPGFYVKHSTSGFGRNIIFESLSVFDICLAASSVKSKSAFVHYRSVDLLFNKAFTIHLSLLKASMALWIVSHFRNIVFFLGRASNL